MEELTRAGKIFRSGFKPWIVPSAFPDALGGMAKRVVKV